MEVRSRPVRANHGHRMLMRKFQAKTSTLPLQPAPWRRHNNHCGRIRAARGTAALLQMACGAVCVRRYAAGANSSDREFIVWPTAAGRISGSIL